MWTKLRMAMVHALSLNSASDSNLYNNQRLLSSSSAVFSGYLVITTFDTDLAGIKIYPGAQLVYIIDTQREFRDLSACNIKQFYLLGRILVRGDKKGITDDGCTLARKGDRLAMIGCI